MHRLIGVSNNLHGDGIGRVKVSHATLSVLRFKKGPRLAPFNIEIKNRLYPET
jgi:hypothetical protein